MVKIIFLICAKSIILTFATSSRAHLLTLFSVAMPALLLQPRWRICIPIEHSKCKNNSDHLLKNLSFKVICLCFLTNTRQGTSASGARHIRIWEEAHPYLGGDAPVSGTRNDRIWDLKRLNARRCLPTNRDTKFSCCFFYDCCLREFGIRIA